MIYQLIQTYDSQRIREAVQAGVAIGLDAVARLGSAKTDMTVDGDKKGSMDNIVTALSGEFGWRFDLSKSMYVEPQGRIGLYTYRCRQFVSLEWFNLSLR